MGVLNLSEAQIKAIDRIRRGTKLTREAVVMKLVQREAKHQADLVVLKKPVKNPLSKSEIDELVHDVRRRMHRRRG